MLVPHPTDPIRVTELRDTSNGLWFVGCPEMPRGFVVSGTDRNEAVLRMCRCVVSMRQLDALRR